MDGKPIAAIAYSTKSEITKLGYLPRIAAFLTKPSQDRHRGSRAKGGLNSESFFHSSQNVPNHYPKLGTFNPNWHEL